MKRAVSLLLVLITVFAFALNFNSCDLTGDAPSLTEPVDQYTDPTQNGDQPFEEEQGKPEKPRPSDPSDSDVPENPSDQGGDGDDTNNCEHVFDRSEYVAEGVRYYCSKCNIRKDMERKCLHEFEKYRRPTGNNVQMCIYCGSGGEPDGECYLTHEFKRVVEPTEYDIGLERAYCESCGYGEIRVLPPLYPTVRACELTLQEYSDNASDALVELALEIYAECEDDKTEEIYAYPFGDLATYKEMRDFVEQLVSGETTELGKARRIYDWVIENIAYSSQGEMWDVGRVWDDKKGVCSQFVQLTHDMLSAADIMSSYTSGYSSQVPWDQNTAVSVPTIYQHAYDTGHAIVTCYVDGRVMMMDPTWGQVLGADEYFDMSEEKVASYFIPVELNMIKVIPEGIDVRNYGGHLRRIGGHLVGMANGQAWNIGAWNCGVNNLIFDFTFLIEGDAAQKFYRGDNVQYVGSAMSSTLLFDGNGFFFMYLPDGRKQNFGEVCEYVMLLNEKYGKSAELPMMDSFEYDGDCLYRRISGGYELFSCKSENQEITVPSTLNGLPVLKVGGFAFNENQSVKKLVVQEGVYEIGFMALVQTAIEELYLPASLENLYSISYTPIRKLVVAEGSEYFKSVDNVLYTKNGEALMYYPPCKEDKEYTVPEGTKVLIAIEENYYLEKLTLPTSLERIDRMVGLPLLSEMTLPAGLTKIGQIFGTSLTEIVVPDGVSVIGGCAFAANEKLKRIVLPESLDYLAYDFVSNCSLLESIEISDKNQKWKTVDNVIFTKDMKTLYVYPSSKKDAFYAVPEGVVEMSHFIFTGHQYIKEISLPSTLKKLPMAAFNTSALEKVNLNYIEELDGATFSGCNNIPTIVLPSNIKKLSSQEFFKCEINLVIQNPSLVTNGETFMHAEGVKVFLEYDGFGEKEKSWLPSVAAVYTRDQWTYVNGVPTPLT